MESKAESKRLLTEKRAVLAIIVLVSLAVRFGVWTSNPFSDEPKKDSLHYHNLAKNLLAHGAFSLEEEQPLSPSGRRMPGYPVFLAMVYGVVGADVRAAKLVQILFGPAICLLTFYLGRLAFRDEAVGILAAGLAAVSPPLIAYSEHLATEGLFTVLLVAATVSAYVWAAKGQVAVAILTAMLWGSLALIKPEAALLPVAVLPVVVLQSQVRRVRQQSLIAAAVVSACILPWIFRNQVVMGKACLITGQMERKGQTTGMLRTYRWQAEHGFLHQPDRLKYFYPNAEAASQRYYAAEAQWRSAGFPVEDPSESDLEFWLRRPVLLIKYSAIRLFVLCLPTGWSEVFGIDEGFSEYREDGKYVQMGAKGAMLLFDASLLFMGGFGFMASLRPKHQELWIISATIAYFTVVYAALHATVRYRVPLLPFLFLLAVWSVLAVVRRRKKGPIRGAASVGGPSVT